MTGSGTQTDPYIIWDWADFFNISDSSCYYKLGCNLDANDYNNGVWTTCTLSCAELDGNGHIVRNINNTSTATNKYALDITAACTIKNLTLKQCLQTAGTTTMDGFFAGHVNVAKNFINCNFEVNSPCIFQTGSASGNYIFDGCTISFDCVRISSSASTQMGRLYRSNLQVNISNSSNLFGFTIINTSRITGDVNCSTSTLTLGYNSGTTNSVIAINTNAKIDIEGNASSPTVVDADLCAAVSGTGALAATTAQMQSAEWLNTNGFAVIAV